MKNSGFTLIELLIAILITALATAAVYSTFITQQRSFITQDEVAETQLSSKIAFDTIANDIRNAGFGYPADENPSINGSAGAITANNAAGPNNSDIITLISGFRQIATLSADAVVGQTQINISYSGGTGFNNGNRSFLSIDGIDFANVDNCTISLSTNECTAGVLPLDRGVNKPFPSGRPVYLIEDVTYQLSGTNLQRVAAGGPPDTIANNIDDLQFAYGIDTNNDGAADSYTNTPQPTDEIITVRVSLLARTANEDPRLEPSAKPYYSTGFNLEGNITPDTDRFRRRVWTMEIAPRNPR